MISHDAEQRSAEWFAIRCGRVTASRIADVCAKTRTGWGASRLNYRAELVAERLTRSPAARYVSAEMQRGIELEPDALAAYEWTTDVTVARVGFVEHPEIAMAGCSPDGLVGDDGLVEVKVPNTSTHIDTLLGAPIPDKYIKQVMFQMACTGRLWCDWVSFDPRLPESMQLFIKRVERDEEMIADLEKEVRVFLGEVDTIVSELRARYESLRAA